MQGQDVCQVGTLCCRFNRFKVRNAIKRHDQVQRLSPMTQGQIIAVQTTSANLPVGPQRSGVMHAKRSLYSEMFVIDNPHQKCIAKESYMRSVRKYMLLVIIGVSCSVIEGSPYIEFITA